MKDTKGLLQQIRHHDTLVLTVNENCTKPPPERVLQTLLQPHRLSYYYFVFMDQGAATYRTDLQNVILSDSQLLMGLPNQVFANSYSHARTQHFKIGFDETTLALLPQSYPFLANPNNLSTLTFNPVAKQRVKAVLAMLFQLLHASERRADVLILLAYLNALLTEFNSAYFEQSQQELRLNPRLAKYAAFKRVVENNLTEQPEIHTIAEELSLTPSGLYSLVKEFSGVSPKEWISNRLIQEAQRKLQYSSVSVKELAYELGFNDPDYFSRVFKKRTGKSVRSFLTEAHDLSGR